MWLLPQLWLNQYNHPVRRNYAGVASFLETERYWSFSPPGKKWEVRCDLWWNSEPCKTCLDSDFITPTLERFGKVRDPLPIKDTQHQEFRKFPACSKVRSCSFSQVFCWDLFKLWSPTGFLLTGQEAAKQLHMPQQKQIDPFQLCKWSWVTEQLRMLCSFLGLQYQSYSQK